MTDNLQMLPPQNLEAEQFVLGAVLLDDTVLRTSRLQPADFYARKHADIWEAMVALRDSGTAIDLLTLSDAMRNSNVLEKCGGASYLSLLVSLVPTAANFRFHEAIVQKCAALRRIIHLCREQTGSAYDGGDPDVIISTLVRGLNDIRQGGGEEVITQRSIVMDAWSFIEKRSEEGQAGKIAGLPTGIRELDLRLDGLHPNYIVVAGESGMGKTALVEGMVLAAAQHLRTEGAGGTVGFISNEMGPLYLGIRSLARSSGVPITRMRQGALHDRDWASLSSAGGDLSSLPIGYRFSSFSDRAIERSMDDFVQRYNARMLVLDYLQLSHMEADTHTREQEVSGVSRMLKRKVKELKVPIIVISSLSKIKGRTDMRPQRSDLRDSGGIEFDSDIILFVYREEQHKPCSCPPPPDGQCLCGRRGKAEIIISKGRMEELGSVPARWIGRTTTFTDA